MPPVNFLNFIALVCISLLVLSSAPAPANALVADRAQVARHVHAREAVARRKRDTPTCKPRPSSSSPPADTPPTPTPTPTPSPTPTPVPSSTSSSSAPSPSNGSSGSSGQKKWCLDWGNGDEWLQNFDLPNIGLLYTWDATKPSTLPAGKDYMIMLWGNDQPRISDFQTKAVAGYANKAAGQNEPNEPSQSNLSPQDAFNVWMQYINPLKDLGYTLYSPACTDDDSGLAWYKEFFSLCDNTPGCQVDVIAFHAYTTSADFLINYATTLHNTYNLPVSITEFADQNFSGTGGQATMDQVWDFAGEVVAFVESTDWLLEACPFAALMDLQGVNPFNSLITPDGQPNDLAHFYFG